MTFGRGDMRRFRPVFPLRSKFSSLEDGGTGKFPADYMFMLTEDELSDLRSRYLTANARAANPPQQGVRRSATDSNSRFHGSSIVPTLLRRGATEPPAICDCEINCLETRLPAALAMHYNPHLSTLIPARQSTLPLNRRHQSTTCSSRVLYP